MTTQPHSQAAVRLAEAGPRLVARILHLDAQRHELPRLAGQGVARRPDASLARGRLERPTRNGLPRRPRGPCQFGVEGGHLKHENAPRRQDPHELPDVAPGELGLHVLKHEQRAHEREGGVVETAKVRGGVHVVSASVAMPVEAPRVRDHRASDVHAVDGLEAPRERLRQPPRTTAEVERPLPRYLHTELRGAVQQIADHDLPVAKELFRRPASVALFLPRQRGPEGVLSTEPFPVPPELAKHAACPFTCGLPSGDLRPPGRAAEPATRTTRAATRHYRQPAPRPANLLVCRAASSTTSPPYGSTSA